MTFLTKQWSASVSACQRSQCHHMDLLKPLEGLFLEAMLTRLRARNHRQRVNVAGNFPK